MTLDVILAMFGVINQAIVYSYFMPVWGIVKTAAPRCRGQLDTLLLGAERPRAMVHRAVHGTEGEVVLSIPPNSHEITVLLHNQC